MKFYFAGSIRGGRDMVEIYEKIIALLSTIGIVLTEHIGDKQLSASGETIKSDKEIYERDISWIDDSDIVIAEVTQPSLGVGYELGYAEANGKKILALFNSSSDRRLSAMVSGNKYINVIKYKDIEDLENKIRELIL